MRKLLLLSLICMFSVTISRAQFELIIGGNMETSSSWFFSSPNGTDVTDTVKSVFNFTSDLPSAGSGGCLELKGFGTTRSVVWQEVDVVPGNTYSFTGLVKNISPDVLPNTWIEMILSSTEPDPAIDYGAHPGDYIYTKNSWMTSPMGDFGGLDGTFLSSTQFLWKSVLTDPTADSVLTASTFTLPDTVAITTWYVAIKAGCWNISGDPNPTFDFLFDKISLLDLDQAPISVKNIASGGEINIFPNPSTGIVDLGLKESTTIRIYNLSGIEIKTLDIEKSGSAIDLSNLLKGMYFIQLESENSTKTYKLILK